MIKERIISFDELSKFGSIETRNDQVKSIVEQQKKTWEIVGKNYEALIGVQTKVFDFGHFKTMAQFNRERIHSSAAKTDAKSISERPCFLCIENLPPEQKGILFQNNYLILVNPYPIFPVHLTISKLDHTPQRILNHFTDLLELSRELTDFTVFYNGPQCGASAPDHFHFQAVIKKSLPVEDEYAVLENQFTEVLFQDKKLKILAVENYFRRFIAIVSKDKNEIIKNFEFLYKNLKSGKGEEPMLNILCSFNDGEWRVVLFPREKQRSSHFYRTDETQLLISPAAVELSGVIVLPREGDFIKITKREIEEIYKEVTLKKGDFERLKNAVKSLLK